MPTLLLSRDDIAVHLSMGECVGAVENAFRLLGEGLVTLPSTMSVHTERGDFHIKAGTLRNGNRHYFAAKTNGDFPANPDQHGLPTIQGIVAAAQSDVIVTCTTSREYLLFPEQVKLGAFVAGVGVDSETKKELAPSLMAQAKVVTDSTTQCARIGDLHNAVEAKAMTVGDVHAELAAIVAGRACGRALADEIIVFDSTGMGLQDVAAAAAIYESVVASGAEHMLRTIEFESDRAS